MDNVRTNHLFRVTVTLLSIVTMGLPAFATAFAVIWSVMFDFEGSTATHCRVFNFLPSISAAISRAPQRYVWKICIALHSAPRFLGALAYLGLHQKVNVGHKQKTYQVMAYVAVGLHIVENAMLVLLTSISSKENKSIHEGSFIVFILSSWAYMLLTIELTRWRLKDQRWKQEKQALKSYKYKKTFAFLNIIGFLTATYLYFRHNWYCEPSVYSYFAMCEYLTIYTNIAFHGTIMMDLRDYSLGVVLTDLLDKHHYSSGYGKHLDCSKCVKFLSGYGKHLDFSKCVKSEGLHANFEQSKCLP